jgi:hypothetical protein
VYVIYSGIPQRLYMLTENGLMDISISAPKEEQSRPVGADIKDDREVRAASLSQALEDSKASGALREVVERNLDHKKRDKSFDAAKKRAVFDIKLDRYEAKYVIPKSLVPQIREYIKPYCDPDPHGSGKPPEYVITTLQLDSPNLSLHYAKLWDFTNRFKLRVRTYGDPVGAAPVFMEVKTKFRQTIVKHRSRIPFDKWGAYLFKDEIIRGIDFKSGKERDSFYQFLRLVKEIGARPVMLIRYIRESYFGKLEKYARITFDRRLQYQQTYSWDSWGRGGQWHCLDKTIDQTRRHDRETDFSGVVLEMKALSDTPKWMVDLASEFELVRVGHCKYSNAVWAESMFRWTPFTPEYEIDFLRYL